MFVFVFGFGGGGGGPPPAALLNLTEVPYQPSSFTEWKSEDESQVGSVGGAERSETGTAEKERRKRQLKEQLKEGEREAEGGKEGEGEKKKWRTKAQERWFGGSGRENPHDRIDRSLILQPLEDDEEDNVNQMRNDPKSSKDSSGSKTKVKTNINTNNNTNNKRQEGKIKMPEIGEKREAQDPSSLLDTAEDFASQAQRRSSMSTVKKEGGGCSCRRTRCLRLHCKCFNELGYCGEDCGCFDCGNRPQFDAERQFVIEKTRRIFPQAFESKIRQLDDETALNNQGCRCKTGCRKKYCDCFKNGAGCSPLCRCEACLNNKMDLTSDSLRRFHCPPFRSKDKIVISAGGSSPDSDRPNALQVSSEQDSRETAAEQEGRVPRLRVGFQTYKRKKSSSKAHLPEIDEC